MKTAHLTDDEIQQYALDSSTQERSLATHVHSCEECKARIANYQLLFSGMKEQPPASFDFNLAELVIAQLPSAKTRPSRDNFFVYLFIISGTGLAGAGLYYFRSYIVSLFTSIAPLFIYLTITTVITLSIILGLDMYKNYQRKMRSLDFY